MRLHFHPQHRTTTRVAPPPAPATPFRQQQPPPQQPPPAPPPPPPPPCTTVQHQRHSKSSTSVSSTATTTSSAVPLKEFHLLTLRFNCDDRAYRFFEGYVSKTFLGHASALRFAYASRMTIPGSPILLRCRNGRRFTLLTLTRSSLSVTRWSTKYALVATFVICATCATREAFGRGHGLRPRCRSWPPARGRASRRSRPRLTFSFATDISASCTAPPGQALIPSTVQSVAFMACGSPVQGRFLRLRRPLHSYSW